MPEKILFVCLGNICRSPTAEGVFRAQKPEVTCDSAGTAGWHVGAPPYGPMQTAARERGVDLSGLRARQLTRADFETFDLILGMDRENLRDINALRPADNTTPVRLLTDYLTDRTADAVPDPYYTRDFEGALDLIENAIEGLCATLD